MNLIFNLDLGFTVRILIYYIELDRGKLTETFFAGINQFTQYAGYRLRYTILLEDHGDRPAKSDCLFVLNYSNKKLVAGTDWASGTPGVSLLGTAGSCLTRQTF